MFGIMFQRRIAITALTLQSLQFKITSLLIIPTKEVNSMQFSRNDIVKFNPEFCTDTEKDRLYIVLESYDDVQRAKVSPVECSLPIIPVESVSYEMIQKA